MRLIFAITILVFCLLSSGQVYATQITDDQAVLDGFWTGCIIQKYCATSDYSEEDIAAIESGKIMAQMLPPIMTCELFLKEVPIRDTIVVLTTTRSLFESEGQPTCLSKVKELQ